MRDYTYSQSESEVHPGVLLDWLGTRFPKVPLLVHAHADVVTVKADDSIDPVDMNKAVEQARWMDYLKLGKFKACEEVDRKTEKLILAGFTFNGVLISFSKDAQFNLSRLHDRRATLPFPLPWNSKDNLSEVVLNGPDDAEAMYVAGETHKLTHLLAGTAIKQTIRGAEDIAAVKAALAADTREL